MKGYKDDSGKFHPIGNSNGVRKSRDQSLKTQGVRMQREVDVIRIKDAGWQGTALDIAQLAQMYKKCNSHFAKDGMEWVNAEKNYYTGSAGSHVHSRSSCPEYSGYCYYCGLNLDALDREYHRKARDISESDIIKMIHDKNLNIEKIDDVDDDGNPISFLQINISKEKTLDAVNGKRDALEIVDHITGMTEEERLRNNITISNGLYELEKEGKIKIKSGKWVRI